MAEASLPARIRLPSPDQVAAYRMQTRAIVLPNVTIGHGAVVSAGSVVFSSVPPQTLVRGNPAEPIARCGVSLGGGVSYEQFLRHLTPIKDHKPS